MIYRRVLVKLSGEMLGPRGSGFDKESASAAAAEFKEASGKGAQVAVLLGGGNIVRARDFAGIDRLSADYMGMTATVVNALGFKSLLEQAGVPSVVMSALNLSGVTEEISPARAVRHLEAGSLVIFAGGTGSPFFTTDTAAALRALEIGADALLKATRVDGVYDSDPEKNPNARLFEKELTFKEASEMGLGVMDRTAFALLEGSSLPAVVFNFLRKGSLARVLSGEDVGTKIF